MRASVYAIFAFHASNPLEKVVFAFKVEGSSGVKFHDVTGLVRRFIF